MDEMKLMLGGIDTHGGRLFYETAREKDALPDYYFTTKSHTNFLHPYTPGSRSLIYISLRSPSGGHCGLGLMKVMGSLC